MGHVQAAPTIEAKIVKCPFCGKGDISIQLTSEYMSVHSSHAAGRRSKIPNYHPERIDVHSKCSECGKTKQEIKEFLKSGSLGKSHEERIEHMKSAGIPTAFEEKHIREDED
jgi:endogenous inhibitor of DNA gyrase (YacG/DUF329 family)